MISDKILIFRNQGIGDLILITPAIRAIRSLHPKAHISVFVGDWSRVSLKNNPYIDEIISYPDPWIQSKKPFRILQLINNLRKKHFSRVYIFHSHTILHLMVYLARIPERYGFSFKGSGKFLTHTTEWQPNTSRYIADNYLDIPRLGGFSGCDLSLDFFLSQDDVKNAHQILHKYNLENKNFYLIAPGGGINPRQNVFEKRWGEDKFAHLLTLLGEEFSAKFVLLGATGEKEICRQIAQNARIPVIDLCGEISLSTSAALLKQSRMLITNDSAFMHIAVAFSIPSVAIFGPSNPLSLLPQNDINRWISAGIDCSPCYCNAIFKGCRRDLACMKQLQEEKVLSVIKQLELEINGKH
jgi:heptosyltransferase-2